MYAQAVAAAARAVEEHHVVDGDGAAEVEPPPVVAWSARRVREVAVIAVQGVGTGVADFR